MASDLQFTEGNKKWKGKAKIFKFNANPKTWETDFMIGFAGTASSIIAVAEYFTYPDTTKPPRVKGLSGIVLTRNGDLFAFDDYDMWLKMDEKFAAIGTGAGLALGAMHAGMTPKEAVKIAGQRDIYTGMGIQTMRF